MGEVESKSFLKFDSLDSYIKGYEAFVEMMDQWVSKADNGYARKYDLVRHDDECKLELTLTVTPHAA